MEENKNDMKEERVYTHQEVEDIVAQINKQARAQCENIAKRCQFLEEQLMYKRLDYLFAVLKDKGVFSMGFVQNCVNEIETALTIPETTQENSNSEKED